jgi:hypothetical protein
MAGRERLRRLAAPLVAAAVVASGCASRAAEKDAGPQPLPPQMVVPPPSDAAPQLPVEPVDERAGVAPQAVEPATKPSSTLIVIDPAESDATRQPSLAEAAARERVRRELDGAQPVLVITNQNLAQHAAGGVLTIAHEPAEGTRVDAEAEAIVAKAAADEKVWRERGLEIRKRWREAADRVPELESKVAELRQRFYSTDDPAVRDGQVKPQWDRALADLEEARYLAAQGAEEVAAFLEEGRRAGALPGWLREGAELEPEPVVVDVEGPADHEPVEPEIYEPPPGV